MPGSKPWSKRPQQHSHSLRQQQRMLPIWSRCGRGREGRQSPGLRQLAGRRRQAGHAGQRVGGRRHRQRVRRAVQAGRPACAPRTR